MNRTAQRRLERLEKRQRKDPYAHMSEQDLRQYCDNAFDRYVEAAGIDEVRAFIERQFTPQQLDQMPDIKAVRFMRGG